ncbi:MAG: hypothetical protein JSV88_02695 [Candidatus Aminicenantes bacterium]|nr:MAG: hypothetical protein JSV88_02695 [Candidatus Aminicenantes bacterium]
MIKLLLKFLWQYPLRMLAYIKNNPGKVLSFIIALYFGLCSIYYDVINQNNKNFYSLPYQFLFAKQNEVTLDQLTGKNTAKKVGKSQKTTQDNLYVFVLDISTTMSKVNMNRYLHSKYVEGIEKVSDQFGYDLIKTKNQPNRVDLAKARLYELLLELLKNKREHAADKFAIWTLGDKGSLVFPLTNKTTIRDHNIKDAILKIEALKQDTSASANYISLFHRFTNVYKQELTGNQLYRPEGPFFILTILSDLLPDAKKQYNARIKRLDHNWEQLEEKIEQIAHPNTIVNMIVFSEDQTDNQKTLLPLLERNFEAFKLNKFFMGDETNILYTIRKSRAVVKFYYSSAYDLSKASFMIKSSSREGSRIKIDLPETAGRITFPQITLYCEKLGAIGDGIGQAKIISSGGCPFRVTLYKNQKIKLTLKQRPFSPNPHPAPALRLTIDNRKETLLIPVTFFLTFPGWVSILFILLHVLLLLTLILKIIPWQPKGMEDSGAYGKQKYTKEKIVKEERKHKARRDTIFIVIFPLLVFVILIYILNQQFCSSPPEAFGKDMEPPLASVEELREKLKITYETQHFKIMRFPNKELVKDYKGDYYWIDIKDADTREVIKFKIEEYTIKDYNRKFIDSMNRFGDEVLKKLENKVPYKIFVKGQADDERGRFERDFDPGFKPERIKYYKKLEKAGGTKFIPGFDVKKVEEPILNTDLPNLRAAFIREKFNELYKDELDLAIILDGEVVLDFSPEYRNAMLILWVKWPERDIP